MESRLSYSKKMIMAMLRLMKNVPSYSFALVAVVLLCSPIGGNGAVSNVHYVDSVGANFLFRGGNPVDDSDNFNFTDLHDAIISAGNESGVKVPKSFYLIDVNLLNQVYNDDLDNLLDEFEVLYDHPELGKLIFWDTRGSDLDPEDSLIKSNASFRQFLYKNIDGWLNDNLIVRVDTLRELLTGSGTNLGISIDRPVVIYVHCIAGCDRTGELISSYQMRYMNQTWQDVNSMTYKYCDDSPIGCNNYKAMKWYCLWSNQKYGFPKDCEENYQCDG